MKENEKKTATASTGGLGFCSVLAIVFIVLKIVGVINWSWFWVLAPIWIPWAIFILFLIIVTICAVVKKKKN